MQAKGDKDRHYRRGRGREGDNREEQGPEANGESCCPREPVGSTVGILAEEEPRPLASRASALSREPEIQRFVPEFLISKCWLTLVCFKPTSGQRKPLFSTFISSCPVLTPILGPIISWKNLNPHSFIYLLTICRIPLRHLGFLKRHSFLLASWQSKQVSIFNFSTYKNPLTYI